MLASQLRYRSLAQRVSYYFQPGLEHGQERVDAAPGVVVGMLAVLGIPPTLGFAGRWRLFETASQSGRWVLFAFVLSSMFALVSYVLALGRDWWGPRDNEEATAHREPLLLCVTVGAMVAILLVAGLWPDAAAALVRGL